MKSVEKPLLGTSGEGLPGDLGRQGKPLQTGSTPLGLASPPLLPRRVFSGNPLILRVDVLECREWVGS